MFRRIALMLVVMVLALSGCKRDEPSAEGGAKPEEVERITLRFWHIYGEGVAAERGVLDAAVRRFEAANHSVAVKVQSFANDDYKIKLPVEIAGGRPPDVFFTWGGGGLAEMARAKKVVDLTDALGRDGWRDGFLSAPLGLCRVDGRIYGVPLDLACVVLWYNVVLFKQHNLTPPRTFDDLLVLCKALRAKGITPLALGNMKQWPGAFYFIYLAARTGGAQHFLDAAFRRKAKFNDPPFLKAGEYLQQLVRAEAFSKGFNGIVHDHARTQFFDGKAAMYLMGTWLVGRARKQPDFLPKRRCCPFPTVSGGRGQPATMVGGVNCGFAVSSSCKHPEKAVALLRYLTATETAEAWAGIGRIPAVRVKDEALGQLPAPTRAALKLLRQAQILQPYYDQYLSKRIAVEHLKTTQGLFALTLTPKAAADRVEKRAQEQE